MNTFRFYCLRTGRSHRLPLHLGNLAIAVSEARVRREAFANSLNLVLMRVLQCSLVEHANSYISSHLTLHIISPLLSRGLAVALAEGCSKPMAIQQPSGAGSGCICRPIPACLIFTVYKPQSFTSELLKMGFLFARPLPAIFIGKSNPRRHWGKPGVPRCRNARFEP